MSHSTTSGGGRSRRLLRLRSMSAARAQRRAQCRAHVGAGAARIGREAPRRHGRAPAAAAGRSPLSPAPARRATSSRNPSPAAARGRRRSSPRRIRARSRRFRAIRGLGCSASASRRSISWLSSCGRSRLISRQHQRHHLLEQLGIAPEDVERLVEQRPLVRPVDEHRVQGPVEIGAVGDADRPHRGDRIDDLARPDRQPRGAQGPREMHQVGDQPAVVFVASAGRPSPSQRFARVPPSPASGRGVERRSPCPSPLAGEALRA